MQKFIIPFLLLMLTGCTVVSPFKDAQPSVSPKIYDRNCERDQPPQKQQIGNSTHNVADIDHISHCRSLGYQ